MPHAANTCLSFYLVFTVVTGSSQNRACAIYAHDSSHSQFAENPNILTLIRGFGNGYRFSISKYFSQLRQFLFPLRFSHLNSSLFTFSPNRPRDSTQIVGYAVVVIMTSQFGFGGFPKFLGLQSPGFLQPFLEKLQLGNEILTASHPFHPKPFAVLPCPAVVGQARKNGTDLLFIMPNGKYFVKGYACQEQHE